MRRTILAVVALACACGDSSEPRAIDSDASARADAGLRVWYADAQLGLFEALDDEKVVGALHGGPISASMLAFGSYNTQLLAALHDGDPPDLFIAGHLVGQGFAGLDLMGPLCKDGSCSACEGEHPPSSCDIDVDGDGRADDVLAAAVSRRVDGRDQAIGVPLFWEYPVVLGNAAWFAANDLKAPRSIAELGEITRERPDAVFHDAGWFFAQNGIDLGGDQNPDFNSVYAVTPELDETGILVVHASQIALMRDTYGPAFDEQMQVLELDGYRPAVSVVAAFVPESERHDEALAFAGELQRGALELVRDPALAGKPEERAATGASELAAAMRDDGIEKAICIGRKGDLHERACASAQEILGVETVEVDADAAIGEIVAHAVADGYRGFLASDPRTALAIDEALIDGKLEADVVSLGRSPQMLVHIGLYAEDSRITHVAAQSRSTLIPAHGDARKAFVEEAEYNLEVAITDIGIKGDPLGGIDGFDPGTVGEEWTWLDFATDVGKGAATGAAAGAAASCSAAGAAAGAVAGAASGAAEYVWKYLSGGLPQEFEGVQFSQLSPETALDY